jgi:uncharacterized lipoprotein YajG
MKKILLKPFIVSIALIVVLAGCSPIGLKYRLDFDFGDISNSVGPVKIVAVDIIDSRSLTAVSKSEMIVAGPENETAVIRKLLVERFKAEGIKIISKPLLADLAFQIDINQLQVLIESGTFKSEFRAMSEFQVTVKKQGQKWSKIFRASRNQEVANPANENEATGLINQLLSEQFNKVFSDQGLQKFVNAN